MRLETLVLQAICVRSYSWIVRRSELLFYSMEKTFLAMTMQENCWWWAQYFWWPGQEPRIESYCTTAFRWNSWWHCSLRLNKKSLSWLDRHITCPKPSVTRPYTSSYPQKKRKRAQWCPRMLYLISAAMVFSPYPYGRSPPKFLHMFLNSTSC